MIELRVKISDTPEGLTRFEAEVHDMDRPSKNEILLSNSIQDYLEMLGKKYPKKPVLADRR